MQNSTSINSDSRVETWRTLTTYVYKKNWPHIEYTLVVKQLQNVITYIPHYMTIYNVMRALNLDYHENKLNHDKDDGFSQIYVSWAINCKYYNLDLSL